LERWASKLSEHFLAQIGARKLSQHRLSSLNLAKLGSVRFHGFFEEEPVSTHFYLSRAKPYVWDRVAA
jgi:hypothetical protein